MQIDDIDRLLQSPEQLEDVPVEHVPALLASAAARASLLSSLQARIAARLISTPARAAGNVQLLNVKQAAERLNVAPGQVRALMARGELRRTKVGRHDRVAVADLEEFVSRQDPAAIEPMVRRRRRSSGVSHGAF